MFFEKEYQLSYAEEKIDLLKPVLKDLGFEYNFKNGEHFFTKDGKKRPNKLSDFQTAIKLMFTDTILHVTIYIKEKSKIMPIKNKYADLLIETCYSVLKENNSLKEEWNKYLKKENTSLIVSVIAVIIASVAGFLVGYLGI